MPLPRLWPQSVNRAWEYILSAVKQGLRPTSTLQAYRDAGEHIGNQLWFDAWHEAVQADIVGEKIGRLPDWQEFNPNLAIDSPFDWRQQWVVQLEVWGEDPETFERYTRWVTVESDDPLSKMDYWDMAQDAISYTPGSIPFQIMDVTDWLFYRRVGRE